jgi:hypothetical protein
MPYPSCKIWEVTYASILHEVPQEGGDSERKTNKDEKW